MLRGKVAVVYGAGGGIGGAVAQAFAREGARLFLAGRGLTSVEIVAKEIGSASGSAEAAEIDALDERAVDTHLEHVMDAAGRVDISFNAIGIPNANIVGVPLIELDAEQFSLAISTYVTSYFLTARLAARRMVPNGSGVIMTVTALHSRTGIPLVGGYGPAQAAKEALTRDLSAELAPGASVWSVSATGHAGDTHDQGCFRATRQGIGHDVGTVARVARKQDPSRTAHDARGDGERGRLHGFRSGERDDGNDRQPDHGEPGRLAAPGTSCGPDPAG
jgi:NAD(P)-dependent dehydrogenase (short-subunit alcohol dehydrogenase family)